MRHLMLLLLAVLALPLTAEAQTPPLRFDLRDPAEAERWSVMFHDESQGPATKTAAGIRSSSGPNGNAALMREVKIDASKYNRLYVKVRSEARGLESGFAAAAAFFNNGPSADILPESRVLTNYVAGQQATLTFHLTESLLWSGEIYRIRVDPIWGPGTTLVTEVWFAHEDTRKAPSWDFTNPDGAAGWAFGEFNPSLRTMPVNFDANGATWSTMGDQRVMQNFDVQFDSSSAKAVRIELRSHVPIPTDFRFFWTNVNPPIFSNDRCIVVPLNGSGTWQTIEIPLMGHPSWNGLVRGIIMNPGYTQGGISVRRVAFLDSGATPVALQVLDSVRWINPEQASTEIQAGRYKPLMVLLTKDGNDFSRRIESQLNADPGFITSSGGFHSVRMQADDQRVPQIFGRVYRVPVLVFMHWDAKSRRWNETKRLEGGDVSSKSSTTMSGLK